MKKIILRLSASFILISSTCHTMPVTDTAQIAESVLTAARWYQQIKTWEREVKQWKEKMEALKKFRLNRAMLEKVLELNGLLEKYGIDIIDLDLNNPKSEIGRYAKMLFESYRIYDDCNFHYLSSEEKVICVNKMTRGVFEIAAIEKFSEEVTNSMNKLNKLIEELEDAKDIKSSQDITAGIQTVSASLQALKMQYEMLKIKNEATEKVEALQKEQIMKKKRLNRERFINQSFIN